MIIEGLSRRLKRTRPGAIEDLCERAKAVTQQTRFVEYCLRTAPERAAADSDLAGRAEPPAGRLAQILAGLAGQGLALPLGPGMWVHRRTPDQLENRILAAMDQFHQQHPESPGITLESLRHQLGLDRNLLRTLVARLKDQNRLAERHRRWALPQHKPAFSARGADRPRAIEALFLQRPYHPPSVEQVGQQLKQAPDEVARLVGILCEHRLLVAVSEGLLFHADTVQQARNILMDFLEEEGRLESVPFKSLLHDSHTPRPLLDYVDKLDVIRRVGNTRYLRSPPAQT